MTRRQRRIDALQQLIARPGTPEEGEAARRALERVMAAPVEEGDAQLFPETEDVLFDFMIFRESFLHDAVQSFAEASKRAGSSVESLAETWRRMKEEVEKQP